MTPEQVHKWEEALMIIISFELVIVVLIAIALEIRGFMTPDPKVIEYFRNCNNLTLYPQGCQVLS